MLLTAVSLPSSYLAHPARIASYHTVSLFWVHTCRLLEVPTVTLSLSKWHLPSQVSFFLFPTITFFQAHIHFSPFLIILHLSASYFHSYFSYSLSILSHHILIVFFLYLLLICSHIIDQKRRYDRQWGGNQPPKRPGKLPLHYSQWPIFACSGKLRSHPRYFNCLCTTLWRIT